MLHLATLADSRDALLFTNRKGLPLRYNQWRKAYFDPAVSVARLTDVNLHDLRAPQGTSAADQHGIMTAAHRLGHGNASVTTRHYARPVADAMEEWASGHNGADGARNGHDDDDDGSAPVSALVSRSLRGSR